MVGRNIRGVIIHEHWRACRSSLVPMGVDA